MTSNDKAAKTTDGSPAETSPAGERIAKRMARAGLCSRRDAERWIAEGRVKLDGELLTSPAVIVTNASEIEVDGKPLPTSEPARLFRFHKPTGYLTAASDPEGRRTINDLIPKELPRLMPVGRLDMNSEGLLLLTNDGGLKRQLELPTTGWQRRYRVRVHGDVDEAKLAKLTDGITINGFDYGPIEANLERALGKNAWLNVALREGKNREIRKVMEHFGWPVNRLIRISFGPFHLGNLARGTVNEIKTKVVKDQVGLILVSATPASQRKRRLKTKRPSSTALSKNEAKAEEGKSSKAKKTVGQKQETLKLSKRPGKGKTAESKREIKGKSENNEKTASRRPARAKPSAKLPGKGKAPSSHLGPSR